MARILRRLLWVVFVEAALWLAFASSRVPKSWSPAVVVVAGGVLVGSALGLALQLRWWLRTEVARRRQARHEGGGRAGSTVAAVPWRRYLVPRELPPPPAQFVGRADLFEKVKMAVEQRRRLALRPLVINVYGEHGIGKSAFILHVATSLIEGFPDGVVYSSLTGASANSERVANVAGDLVDSLQGPGEVVPPPKNRTRELRRLSRRWPRVLYVFDDVQSAEVIRPLLPVAARSVVLVSSINRLRGLPSRVKVIHFEPEPLTEGEALGLLEGLLGQPKLDEVSRTALRQVVDAAARFPFALHLAARAINSRGVWALAEIAALLPTPHEGGAAPTEATAGETMLDLSINVLNADQRRLLLVLDRLPDEMQPFAPWMARELVNAGEQESEQLSDEDVWKICERLADQRLLERISADATGVVRFRLPDRVRSYLRARAVRDGPPPDATAPDPRAQARALLRRLGEKRVQRTVAEGAGRDRDAMIHQHLLQGRLSEAVDEARGALADVREAKDWGAKEGNARRGRSALMSADERGAMAVLAEVLAELGGLDDAVEIASKDRRMRADLGAAAPPPDLATARSARMLGRLHRRQLKISDAVRELEDAIGIASGLGDAGIEEVILAQRELAAAYSIPSAEKAGEPKRAEGITKAEGLGKAYVAITSATGLLPAVRDPDRRRRLECRLREAGAVVRLHHVDYHGGSAALLDEAYELLDSAIRDLDDEFALWHAWFRFHQARVVRKQADKIREDTGDIDTSLQRMADARRLAEDAVRRFSAMKHRYGTARCRLEIGQTYALDRPDVAIPMLEDARETFIFCGDRWIEARTALTLARARFRREPESDAGHDEFTFALRVFTALNDKASLFEVEQISASLSRRS